MGEGQESVALGGGMEGALGGGSEGRGIFEFVSGGVGYRVSEPGLEGSYNPHHRGYSIYGVSPG